ncbi:MAG TPA: PEP-CTERM sorting domain-containing protein [Rhizomicrobium sp.]|nr:PEP-CTERM sorting domain-containing protein [Rhizomicrobium sp.]
MSKFLSAVATAAFLVAGASAANAGVLFSSVAFDAPPSPGEVMVMDFDNPIAAGYSMTWSGAGLYQGPLVPGIAAPPFGDNTQYLAVLAGGLATLTAPGVMHSMSVYLGSIDDYNTITFKGLNGFSQSFTGADLTASANGDQFIAATNRRYEFTFDPNDLINQVLFSSSGNSFEFDNIAVNDPPARVPEPLTLSLFAAGLAGMAGLRRRKAVTA